MELVSGHISRGDIESLNGLVTPEVISIVKESLEELTLKQRQDFKIRQEDMYFCFPYEVGVMFPNEDSKFSCFTICPKLIEKGLNRIEIYFDLAIEQTITVCNAYKQ